jgi:hypothetical protein
MLGHDDGLSFLVHFPDKAKDLIPTLWVKLRSGLVQDHHLRLQCQNTGDGQTLLLAARQLIRRPAQHGRKAASLCSKGDALPHERALIAKVAQGEGDLIFHGRLRKLTFRILQDNAYKAYSMGPPTVLQAFAIDIDLAFPASPDNIGQDAGN